MCHILFKTATKDGEKDTDIANPPINVDPNDGNCPPMLPGVGDQGTDPNHPPTPQNETVDDVKNRLG